MSIELKLFVGLLLAFVGDYITQGNRISQEKTKRFLPAFIHATIYSLPFLVVCWSWTWFILWISHFFIDRYRLAVYVVRLKNFSFGLECIETKIPEGLSYKYKWVFRMPDASNFGFPKEVPAFMSIWLMIIVDNVIHVCINSMCIYFG